MTTRQFLTNFAARSVRSLAARLLLVVTIVATVSLNLSPALSSAQQPAPPGDVAIVAKEAKPVDKVYIVGYAMVVLMCGLGVLVVCHYRPRKDRPDLPQEMLAERLRQGVKAPPAQKAN
jgi:hypothetical protein